jgi:hypothetical protein
VLMNRRDQILEAHPGGNFIPTIGRKVPNAIVRLHRWERDINHHELLEVEEGFAES